MLRIKKDKIKKLKKIGFKESEICNRFVYEVIDVLYYGGIYIDKINNYISISGNLSCDIGKNILSILYNMFKLDMIEEVEDDSI